MSEIAPGVRLTESAVTFRGITIPLSQIVEVEVIEIPSRWWLGIPACLLGGTAGIFGWFMHQAAHPLGVYLLGTCVSLLVAGLALILVAKARYAVRVRTAAGTRDVVVTGDPKVAAGATRALRKALG